MEIQTRIQAAAGALWQWLRGASGDHAYDCYTRHAEKHGEAAMSRQEFYLEHERRKYSRVSRCC